MQRSLPQPCASSLRFCAGSRLELIGAPFHRLRGEQRYDDGKTDAACTWLTMRPHDEADERMRAQRAVSSMARVRIDHPTRPDTELQSDPSSPQPTLAFPGRSIQSR